MHNDLQIIHTSNGHFNVIRTLRYLRIDGSKTLKRGWNIAELEQ